MTTPWRPGVYPIADLEVLGRRSIDPLRFCAEVLRARPPLLQLRGKHAPAREVLALLRALRAPCTAAGTLLVANDRPDLALLAGADVVHVGQGDPSIDEVRQIAPALRVGVSTHTPEQLDEALRARPFYVAFGPVFSTTSKERPDPVVGVDGLTAASARARSHGVPLVAIGGIDSRRAASIVEWVDAVSVIGALVPDDGDLGSVAERTRAIASAWRRSA